MLKLVVQPSIFTRSMGGQWHIDKSLKPKKIKKHRKTGVYSSLPGPAGVFEQKLTVLPFRLTHYRKAPHQQKPTQYRKAISSITLVRIFFRLLFNCISIFSLSFEGFIFQFFCCCKCRHSLWSVAPVTVIFMILIFSVCYNTTTIEKQSIFLMNIISTVCYVKSAKKKRGRVFFTLFVFQTAPLKCRRTTKNHMPEISAVSAKNPILMTICFSDYNDYSSHFRRKVIYGSNSRATS